MKGKEYKGKSKDLVSKNVHNVYAIWMMNSFVDKSMQHCDMTVIHVYNITIIYAVIMRIKW